MAEPEYLKEVNKTLKDKGRLLITTGQGSYIDDCVDVLSYLIKEKGLNVIIITFDSSTPNLIAALRSKKVDVSRINIIDAVLISMGQEGHYSQKLIKVRHPGSFADIEVYTYLFIKQLGFKDVCIFFYSLNRLESYRNMDEIGCFLNVFGKHIDQFEIPEVLMVHKVMESTLMDIFSRHTHKKITYG